MTAVVDLTGQMFGRLTAINRLENDVRPNGRTYVVWECICSCGVLVKVRSEALRSGESKSCGCLKRDMTVARNTSHGLSKTREFVAWHAMRQRCESSWHASCYSGRGISVCDRWSSLEQFVADMGRCPDGFELDRIDVNKGYEPGNCRWVSRSVQAYNKRRRTANTSGVTGVCKARRGKWRARITVERREYSLGEYESFEDACKARKQAELKYFGFHPGHG